MNGYAITYTDEFGNSGVTFFGSPVSNSPGADDVETIRYFFSIVHEKWNIVSLVPCTLDSFMNSSRS